MGWTGDKVTPIGSPPDASTPSDPAPTPDAPTPAPEAPLDARPGTAPTDESHIPTPEPSPQPPLYLRPSPAPAPPTPVPCPTAEQRMLNYEWLIKENARLEAEKARLEEENADLKQERVRLHDGSPKHVPLHLQMKTWHPTRVDRCFT
jgi:hypothetical protein